MKIVQITPGAGGMYCGGCFRDNALVAALRQLGHETLMVPLYLPLTLDEENQSQGTPIFFGGINVYLQQKVPFLGRMPNWLHGLLNSPRLLKYAAGSAAKTRAEDVGDLMLSMLRGEEGNQLRELNDLIGWLQKGEHPEVVCLSNALLLGLGRKIKKDLSTPLVCLLSGEDSFLDSLPASHREVTWKTMSERAEDVDLFVAPTQYYAGEMQRRLQLPDQALRVVPNGINCEGFTRGVGMGEKPVVGYFARMCREKGLDLLVEAYIRMRKRGKVESCQLKIGGGLGPADESFVTGLRGRLEKEGLGAEVQICPNLDRSGKIAFLQSLSVFSVPALYGESFGLYLLEALAVGVPIVQPRHAGFPEIVEATGGGLICEPTAEALSLGIEELLLDKEKRERLGSAGREVVVKDFSVEQMAKAMVKVYEEAVRLGKVALGHESGSISKQR